MSSNSFICSEHFHRPAFVSVPSFTVPLPMVDGGGAADVFTFEEPELFSGAPAAAPAAAPGEMPPPPVPQVKREKRKDADKTKEKLCAVCEKNPCVPKFCYCKECKKEVQSCHNSAKQAGREADFKKLSGTSAGLRHLIAHYRSKCPSRGQGVPRDQMDWVAYLAIVYKDDQFINGSKEVWMDFPDYEKHCEEKGKSKQEAIDGWAAMEASDLEHDFKGREKFEKRFPVSVEDYRIKQEVKGSREDRDCVSNSF